MRQEDLARTFREAELLRRKARHEQLLQNEAALQAEPLTADDSRAHKLAVKNLQKYNRAVDKQIHGGYWSRLWAALWGR